MIHSSVLCRFIVIFGLVGTVFYSNADRSVDSLSTKPSRGYTFIAVSQAMSAENSFSVTISVIMSYLNDSLNYTIIGPSTPPSQTTTQGPVTFTNLLPGSYAINVTNLTLGVPVLEAQLLVSADFSGTRVIATATSTGHNH